MEETIAVVLDDIQDRSIPHWSVSLLVTVLFLLFLWSGWGHFTWFGTIGAVALDDAGALNTALVDKGELWRLAMSVFLHAGWIHLLTNLLNIYVLGMLVHRLYGTIWLWFTFGLSGCAGSLLTWGLSTERTVGASGAIFGWIGLLLVVGWKYRSALQGEGGRLFRHTLLGWTIFSLVLGELIPFIDNAAHLGGLLVGVTIGWMMKVRT